MAIDHVLNNQKLTYSADCILAVLGIHLFGDYVVPMVVLDPWARTRDHLHDRRCRIRVVHFIGRLVSCAEANTFNVTRLTIIQGILLTTP